jgi:tetratricopeptide (TPR) repeat protein
LLVALLLATAEPALAAGEADGQTSADATPNEETVKEAGKRYETGLGLYAEGEFKLAVIEFERAYALVSDYRVLYNIGQVRIQLGDYARARTVLEQYLKDGGDRIAPERKASVENDLKMLEGRTATLRVVTSIAGAEILVDDRPVGTAPLTDPILLDAGDHRVVVRVEGREPGETRVTLAGRDASEIQLEPGKSIENRPVVVVDRQEGTNRNTWRWAAWSATGVFAVGAGVTGFLGIRAANDLDDLRETPGASREELDSAQRRARTLLFTADVMGVAAIATGGVALYLTLSGPSESEKKKPGVAKVSAEIRPNWVGVNGHF